MKLKHKLENIMPFIIKIDIFLELIILVLAIMDKSRNLNPQWYTINFFIFIGGLYIYTKTKNKIFYSVFLYALIFSSMVLIDLMIPGGIISENNKTGDFLVSGVLIFLGFGGFFIGLYLIKKK